MNKLRQQAAKKKKARPIPIPKNVETTTDVDKNNKYPNLVALQEELQSNLVDEAQELQSNDALKLEVERFIEISKYFSSPLRKTASYVCETRLVSYPNPYRIDYTRGGITTQHIKFTNLVLEPIFIKLYKIEPELEQIKFSNLSLSKCKRIPPGLSFNLGFVYDDLNERPSRNAKIVFVASRKTTTPCYQICEMDILINAQKIRLVTV